MNVRVVKSVAIVGINKIVSIGFKMSFQPAFFFFPIRSKLENTQAKFEKQTFSTFNLNVIIWKCNVKWNFRKFVSEKRLLVFGTCYFNRVSFSNELRDALAETSHMPVAPIERSEKYFLWRFQFTDVEF